MATISFDRPLIIKNDDEAAAFLRAANCTLKPIDDSDILEELERGLRLLKRELSD